MRVAAIAHQLPSREISNPELIDRVLAHEGNRVPRTERASFRSALRKQFVRAGAHTRFHRAPGERSLDLGLAAGRRALAQAHARPEDIDLLVFVGVGRGFLEPATANVFLSRLGLTRATGFDVLDACASWMRGLDLVSHLMATGACRRAMLLNAECNFDEYIRWDFGSIRDLTRLFAGLTVGEAATATVLEASPEAAWECSFRTGSEGHELCQIPLPHATEFGGSRNGDPPLRFFAHAQELHALAIDQLERHWRDDDRFARRRHDLLVGHSTSVPAMRAVVERLRLDPRLAFETFTRYGNTVSASIPLALSLAHDGGRLRRGDAVQMVMASAGVTTGLAWLRF